MLDNAKGIRGRLIHGGEVLKDYARCPCITVGKSELPESQFK